MPSQTIRVHNKSTTQKWIFMLLHLGSILFGTWLLFFNGLEISGTFFGKAWSFSDPIRATILWACAVLYFLRHSTTLFYLLFRQVPYAEVVGLSFFFIFFEIGFLLLGGGAFSDHAIALNTLDIVAIILLFIGSYLNTFSELQRQWWKAKQENKGRLYTQGLFTHTMHINFFGDVVLFTGWALLTQNLWSLSLPFLMAIMFIFFHIPTLDDYLRERYKKDFLEYENRTKKLVPFIY